MVNTIQKHARHDLGVTLFLPCSFKTQFWGAAFGSNFGEQLSGAALENSSGLGQPLCRGTLGNNFGK